MRVTRAKSLHIESRFRSNYLAGRMILSEKSATFRDHALGRTGHTRWRRRGGGQDEGEAGTAIYTGAPVTALLIPGCCPRAARRCRLVSDITGSSLNSRRAFSP